MSPTNTKNTVIIGLDFDGTLATWGRGEQPNYDDARYAICYANAIYPSISFVKREKANGHEFVLITGRGVAHRRELQAWCKSMLGFSLPVICRPATIGLACAAQASWKASMISSCGARIYLGDNDKIDAIAAKLASIRYMDVSQIRRQFMFT
jgi:hypothetical protein